MAKLIEEWRTIRHFPNYQVSNFGSIRSLTHLDSMNRIRQGKIKKLKKHKNGYLVVALNHDTQLLVHRIVAQEFIGIPHEGYEVNHKDGNKQNNVVTNLEWVTKSQNQRHRYNVLKAMPSRQLCGFDRYRDKRKMVRKKVSQELLDSDLTLQEVKKLTGVSISTISRMRNEK